MQRGFEYKLGFVNYRLIGAEQRIARFKRDAREVFVGLAAGEVIQYRGHDVRAYAAAMLLVLLLINVAVTQGGTRVGAYGDGTARVIIYYKLQLV